MKNNKSQRIKINLEENTDKYLKIKLEQDIEQLDILSLKLRQEDIYNTFNADFGVVVGRVIANEGIGVPNAKLSIFIPISEEDKDNAELFSLYPYESPRDKNVNGKRYNLLPRTARLSETGVYKPQQPFGSFPNKEEISTNETLLEIYEKYYKFTTVTNDSGDYMFFGVPVGVQTVHMSVDLTDIGKYSMTPASMITNLGYSPNLFIENGTKIKPSTDLDDLPHIETQEISVDVLPFWGDKDLFDIGITRQDFRIRAALMNVFTIFGSAFTDGPEFMWGGGNSNSVAEFYFAGGTRVPNDRELNLAMDLKRINIIEENIYYYPNTITDEWINNDAVNEDPEANLMIKLDRTEYSSYKRDGDFVYIINCNRKKVITAEDGTEIEVEPTNVAGVFTEFKGFATLEYTVDDLPMNFTDKLDNRQMFPLRYKIKIPQYANQAESFAFFNTDEGYALSSGFPPTLIPERLEKAANNTAKWRHQHYTFKAGNLYSISKFIAMVYNNSDTGRAYTNGFMYNDRVNSLDTIHVNHNHRRFVGILYSDLTGRDDEDGDLDNDDNFTGGTLNTLKELPSNGKLIYSNGDEFEVFGGNWLNFGIHLPQVGRLLTHTTSSRLRSTKSTTHFTIDFRSSENSNLPSTSNYYEDNFQPIAAGDYNTKWFCRSDLHWTDFIEVPVQDVINILNIIDYELDNNRVFPKGFKKSETIIEDYQLTGNKYRNGLYNPNEWQENGINNACPRIVIDERIFESGKIGIIPNNAVDDNTYFYRGRRSSDCIEYLRILGIV